MLFVYFGTSLAFSLYHRNIAVRRKIKPEFTKEIPILGRTLEKLAYLKTSVESYLRLLTNQRTANRSHPTNFDQYKTFLRDQRWK